MTLFDRLPAGSAKIAKLGACAVPSRSCSGPGTGPLTIKFRYRGALGIPSPPLEERVGRGGRLYRNFFVSVLGFPGHSFLCCFPLGSHTAVAQNAFVHSGGGYKLVKLASGLHSVHSLAHQETFHPVIGPVAEAEALYVRQLGLVERLQNHTGEFVIWDV